MGNDHITPEQHRQQAEGVRAKAEDSRHDAEQDRLSEMRRSISGDWQRKRGRSATGTARRSIHSGRNGSACGTPGKRREAPVRRHEPQPRLRVMPRWMLCAPPPKRCMRRSKT